MSRRFDERIQSAISVLEERPDPDALVDRLLARKHHVRRRRLANSIAVGVVAIGLAAGSLVLLNAAFNEGPESVPATPGPDDRGGPAPSVDPDPRAVDIYQRFGQIAFAGYRDGAGDIYVVSESGYTRLTDGNRHKFEPSWSPDGRYIAYSVWSEGRTDLYLLDLTNHTSSLLTPLRADEGDPTWTADSRWVTFTSNERSTHIEAVNIHSGEMVTLVSDPQGSAFYPSWAADGRTLYFTLDILDGTEGGDIYAQDFEASPDGPPTAEGEPRLLAGGQVNQAWPAPSPDGELLAYVQDEQIWVLDLRSERAHQVTSGPGSRTKPSWSPDGEQIVFSSDEGSSNDLFVVNADGSGLENLTRSPGLEEVTPDWHP